MHDDIPEKQMNHDDTDRISQQEKVFDRLQKEGMSMDETFSFLSCCAEYYRALVSIRKYDEGTENTSSIVKETTKEYHLTIKLANLIIKELKIYLESHGENVNLFGIPRNGRIDQVVNNIYQTWDSKELYESVEDKAAHMFYFLVKDHIFLDGNKRIASFLFIWFIDMNNLLVTGVTNRTIPYHLIYTLAIYVAESKPQDKDVIVNLIRNILMGYSETLPDSVPANFT